MSTCNSFKRFLQEPTSGPPPTPEAASAFLADEAAADGEAEWWATAAAFSPDEVAAHAEAEWCATKDTSIAAHVSVGKQTM